jgi:hypothetical protein
VCLRTKADAFAFIDQKRGRFGVMRLCRLFGVTRAGGATQSMTRGGAPGENAHRES